MTLKNKSIITVVLLLISFILGCYLSGFILLQWLGLDKTPLLLTTWFKYYNTLDIPQVQSQLSLGEASSGSDRSAHLPRGSAKSVRVS